MLVIMVFFFLLLKKKKSFYEQVVSGIVLPLDSNMIYMEKRWADYYLFIFIFFIFHFIT